MDRRVFMKSGAMALVTMGLSPSFLRRTAFGAELLRGARRRQRARTHAHLPLPARRGRRAERGRAARRGGVLRAASATSRSRGRRMAGGVAGAIDLDGFFGLHPALAPFKPLWDRGLLAPIHAVGSPSTTRSHFDAQDYMETRHARPEGDAATAGSIAISRCRARARPAATHDAAQSPFRAVSMTQQTPRILEGPQRRRSR